MMSMMIELILVAFMIGAIVGAAVAVHLKSSTGKKQWSQDAVPEDETLVYVKEEQNRPGRRR